MVGPHSKRDNRCSQSLYFAMEFEREQIVFDKTEMTARNGKTIGIMDKIN